MTTQQTVGLIGLGEMGGGVAKALTQHGITVVADLSGRGAESVERAKEAGITPVEGLRDLVASCDVLLSIVPPSVAEEIALQVAEIGDASCLFVEANAISPGLATRISTSFAAKSLPFLDGGIVGMPPKGGSVPRLYVSGPDAATLNPLDGMAFDLRDLGPEIGKASGFKMSYAGLTKGSNALLTAMLLTAARLDILEPYLAELEASQPASAQRARGTVSRMPSDAGRWVREMTEIRETLEGVGLPGGFHGAAEDMMRLLDDSPFGHETRRTFDASRTLEETLKGLG